jgi:hypothetical protein
MGDGEGSPAKTRKRPAIIERVDSDALARELLGMQKAGPSLPSRQARDNEKAEAAEVRNRTAWQRVMWAIDGLQGLLLLRNEFQEMTVQLSGTR